MSTQSKIAKERKSDFPAVDDANCEHRTAEFNCVIFTSLVIKALNTSCDTENEDSSKNVFNETNI